MSKERTSIIPHLADLVQNVVTKTLQKKIDAYAKKVKEFELEVGALVFDQHAQDVYKNDERLQPYLHKTAATLEFRYSPEMFTPTMQKRFAELMKKMGGGPMYEIEDSSSFVDLPAGFDRCTSIKGAFWTGASGGHSNIRGGTTLKGSALIPSGSNSYSRVVPTGYRRVLICGKPYRDSAEYRVVPPGTLRTAGRLLLESIEIHSTAIELSSELWDAFRQRQTVERFKEEFPELVACLPYIPTKVKALVTPSLSVVKTLKKEGLAVPVE